VIYITKLNMSSEVSKIAGLIFLGSFIVGIILLFCIGRNTKSNIVHVSQKSSDNNDGSTEEAT